MSPAVAVALVLLAIPTAGASCVPLWILADRASRRALSAGQPVPRGATLMSDVGFAGTVVFGAVVTVMVLYGLHFANQA